VEWVVVLDGTALGKAEKRAALHERQSGRCAVCGATGRLVADHDHNTGLLRGLLCPSCNNREGGLGGADIDAYRAPGKE
jgi:Recombination endonuclease VII